MKTIINALLIVSLFFISCKKSDDTPETKTFTINVEGNFATATYVNDQYKGSGSPFQTVVELQKGQSVKVHAASGSTTNPDRTLIQIKNDQGIIVAQNQCYCDNIVTYTFK